MKILIGLTLIIGTVGYAAWPYAIMPILQAVGFTAIILVGIALVLNN